MNQLLELRLHAQALLEAVEQVPEFFASVNLYVRRLNDLLGGGAVDLTQDELDVVAQKIEAFFARWRRSPGSTYIPPRETANTDGIVRDIVRLVSEIAVLPRDEFLSLTESLKIASPSSHFDSAGKGSVVAPRQGRPLTAVFRRHPVVFVATLVASVAGAVWAVAVQVLVQPRDFEIARLRRELDEVRQQASVGHEDLSSVVLEETGVFEGQSATTSDGACTIKVLRTSEDIADFEVSLNADSLPQPLAVMTGRRGAIRAETATYYVDVHRIRGNIVDMSVYKAPR